MVGGIWVVEITEGLSPLANVIETVKCPGGRESAFQTYRQIMKELGRGY